jgi:hypothetical protein
MVFVDYDLRLWKQFTHEPAVSACHIHHDEPDVFSVIESKQMMTDHLMFSCRQDVHDPAVLRVSQDTLELLALCVTPELIDGQHFRQPFHSVVDLIDDLRGGRRGHIVIRCDTLDAAAFLQLPEDLHIHTVRELAVSWKEFDLFIEPFPAVWAYMTAFAQVKDCFISADGNVSYDLGAVVMDFTRDAATLRTTVKPLLHSHPAMHFVCLTFNICDDYIF